MNAQGNSEDCKGEEALFETGSERVRRITYCPIRLPSHFFGKSARSFCKAAAHFLGLAAGRKEGLLNRLEKRENDCKRLHFCLVCTIFDDYFW